MAAAALASSRRWLSAFVQPATGRRSGWLAKARESLCCEQASDSSQQTGCTDHSSCLRALKTMASGSRQVAFRCKVQLSSGLTRACELQAQWPCRPEPGCAGVRLLAAAGAAPEAWPVLLLQTVLLTLLT